MPIIRSLLIGILVVGGLLGLYLAAIPEVYERHLAGLPGLPPLYSRAVVTTISWLDWAWVTLSIAGSYMWHTRHLDRTTRVGIISDALMLLQYVFWLVLGLGLQLFLNRLSQSVIR